MSRDLYPNEIKISHDLEDNEDVYLGLNPPPSTRTNDHNSKVSFQKDSLPSTECHHIKNGSVEIHHLDYQQNH